MSAHVLIDIFRQEVSPSFQSSFHHNRAISTWVCGTLSALWLLIGAAGGWAFPVVDVIAGYDGFYTPGLWTPILVTINNQPSETEKGSQPEPFEGILEVKTKSLKRSSTEHTFTQTIKVPAYSIQRFYLYAKFPDTNQQQVITTQQKLELRDKSGKILQSYPLSLNALAPGKTLMVTVSDDFGPSGLPVLNTMNPLKRANARPAQLPEHWWGYESVGMLVLSQWNETYLRPKQALALRQWVESGGMLVLLAGSNPNSWRGGLIDDLAPATIQGSERVRAAQGGRQLTRVEDSDSPVSPSDIILNRCEPKTEAQVLAATLDETPLLMRAYHGNGAVLLWAVDLQSKLPNATRVLLASLWRSAIPYQTLTTLTNTWRNDFRRNFPVVSGRAARPPNVALIFLILVCYAIIVGPVNFRMLSANGKRWRWRGLPFL